MKQKKFFFWKKKIKMVDSKKTEFFSRAIFTKIHRLVLGLVGLIDAKGINVTQPIWPSGCPT